MIKGSMYVSIYDKESKQMCGNFGMPSDDTVAVAERTVTMLSELGCSLDDGHSMVIRRHMERFVDGGAKELNRIPKYQIFVTLAPEEDDEAS